MKNCLNCNAPLNDDAVFCGNCGAQCDSTTVLNGGAAPNVQENRAPEPAQQGYQARNPPPIAPTPVMMMVDPFDHTAEFDPRDISDNKVYAILIYICGLVGVFISLFASHDSPYVSFHMRQYLKMYAVSMIFVVATSVLAWTILVPLASIVIGTIIFVLRIIAFFQVCSGKAKEPAIIKNLKFFK